MLRNLGLSNKLDGNKLDCCFDIVIRDPFSTGGNGYSFLL